MSPILEAWMKQAGDIAVRGIANKEPLVAIQAKERALAERIPYLSVREINFLVQGALAFARGCQRDLTKMGKTDRLRRLQKVANEMDRRLQLKAKTVLVTDTIEKAKHAQEPTVFFLSSWHQKPAEGHKELQGKVFYDMHWRQTLRDRNMEFLIPVVRYCIREKAMMSVQDSMKAPYYLVLRPYCSHAFYPVSINEVVSKSVREIKDAHHEAFTHKHRSMTDKQRYQKQQLRFNHIRKTVGKELQKRKTAV